MSEPILHLVLATFAVCSIGSFQFSTVVTCNVLADVLKPWINQTNVERYGTGLTEGKLDTIWAVFTGLFFAGMLVGSLTVKAVARVFGRRNAILFASTFVLISHALTATGRFFGSWEMLMASRLILGTGVSCAMAIGAMYLTEIPPVEYRGRCGSAIGIALGAGEVFGGIVGLPVVLGTPTYWPLAITLPGIVAVIGIGILIFLHDSPRYLYIAKHDIPRAERAVTFFQSGSLDKLLSRMRELSIEKSLSAEKRKQVTDLFREKSNRKMAIVVVAINMGCGFAGASGVMSFSALILHAAGLTFRQAKFVTMGLAGAFFIGSIVAGILVDKIGRRKSLIIGWVGSLASTVVVTITTGMVTYGGIRESYLAWICAGCMIAFTLLFGIQEAVGLFIAAELFSQDSRDAAATLAGFVFSLTCAVEGTIFPFLVEFGGITVSFMPFVVFPLINLIITLILLPETMGRTITDVRLTVDTDYQEKLQSLTPLSTDL